MFFMLINELQKSVMVINIQNDEAAGHLLEKVQELV